MPSRPTLMLITRMISDSVLKCTNCSRTVAAHQQDCSIDSNDVSDNCSNPKLRRVLQFQVLCATWNSINRFCCWKRDWMQFYYYLIIPPELAPITTWVSYDKVFAHRPYTVSVRQWITGYFAWETIFMPSTRHIVTPLCWCHSRSASYLHATSGVY